MSDEKLALIFATVILGGYGIIFLISYNWDYIISSKSDRAEIENVWREFYAASVDSSEKAGLMSSGYKKSFMKHVDHAYNLSEHSLRKRSFEDKLRILQLRDVIVKNNLKQNELTSFEKAFAKIHEPHVPFINLDEGLRHIFFESGRVAYGSYTMFFVPKASQFVKEQGQWKINPYIDHEILDNKKAQIKFNNIQRYGGADNAIDSMMKYATESTVSWSPINY